MSLAGQSNIQNARTTYETVVDNALLQDRDSGAWNILARKRTGTGGMAVQYTVPGATPPWEEWAGEKSGRGARKLTKTVTFKKYHKTLVLDRSEVVNDQDGSTGEQIEAHVRDVGYVYDKVVFASLATNPTGADGVSLINDTHPFGSTTYDNKTTTALGWDSFNSGIAAMRAAKDEYGEHLRINPDYLIVHPDEERIALEITGAENRPVSVGTGAPMTISGAGVGATQITNVYRGRVNVIVTPYWVSGDWLLVDSRIPPMALAVWREPETVILDQMTDEPRFMRDELWYSVEADVNADGLWHLGLYGKIT